MLRKTSGMATVLTDALQPIAAQIQCALVFGSVARGEEATLSDVDVLVLGDVSFAEVMEVLHPVQEEVEREINPVVYRIADFNAKLALNNTWAREVVDAVLDGLRKQRNINDYDGDPISPTLVDECIKQARALLAHVHEWLAEHRPDVR